jgi:hypothetical protein
MVIRRSWVFVVLALLCVWPAPAAAQGPAWVAGRLAPAALDARIAAAVVAQVSIVRNPRAVVFECPDHDQDTGHEIDIVRVSDGAVIQTIQGGDPASGAVVDGLPSVTIPINVQPVIFGAYRVVVRAVAGSFKSDSSDPSAIWERAPGKPTAPRAGSN